MHISGTYANEGQQSDGSKEHLATWLYPFLKPRSERTPDEQSRVYRLNENTYRANTVDIVVSPNGDLLVKIDGEEFTDSWSFSRKNGENTCTNGVLIVSRNGFEGEDIFIGYSSRTVELHSSNDALLVNHRMSGAGTGFIVIPIATHESYWGRFKRIK